MKHLIIGLFAACAALAATAANEYYVDAVNGVDDEAHDGSSWAKAKQTLSVACALATEEGDTVYVAEGDYKTGSDGGFRAKLADGTKLIGVGDRNKIRIFGSATGPTRSATPLGDDLRCISGGTGTLVKNVTLCNGRGYGVNGGAGSATYWVACVFSNNYVNANSVSNKGRGGALGGGTAVRCLFKRNSSDSTGKCIYSVMAWNCVFDQSGETAKDTSDYVSNNSYTYNCTVTGSGGCSVRAFNHYNLLCRVVDGGSASTYLYHSLFSKDNTKGSVAGDDKTLFNVGDGALPLDADYRPLLDNIGIDYGSNLVYTANFPTSELVADQKYLDFNGNPRIIGEAIDVGACEFDPDDRLLSISDAQTGLTVTGAEKGEVILRRGETNTFTLARNYSTQKLCTGVRVNGEFFSFTGDDADKTYEYTYGYGDPTTALVIEAVYAEHNDWYVNPTTGDDVNNNGYTRYQAKKTIAAAMTNDLIDAGDTVHAAPGVYRDAPFGGKKGETASRVTVKAGVGLVADEGPAVTAIEGETDASEGHPDSIRCVAVETGGYIKGFTLRNGSTATPKNMYDRGGGVYGGTAIDCVITNCTAVRGGGAYNADLIRCRVEDCSTIGSNASGGAFYSCSAYDSYIEGGYTDPSRMVNCYASGKATRSSGSVVFYNCYADDVPRTAILSNCLYRSAASDSDVATSTKVSAAPAIDPVTLRPIRGKSDNMIDAGVNAYHTYPSAFASELGKDLAGGQRIYNQKIDIGCGEYDWRGDFAKRLAAKGVAVEAASANVTTNDLNGLVLFDGDALKLKLVCKADGKASLKVVSSDIGGGNVTVKVGETEAPGLDGLYAFDVSAGETVVEISFSGTGTATLSDVTIPKMGLLLLFR